MNLPESPNDKEVKRVMDDIGERWKGQQQTLVAMQKGVESLLIHTVYDALADDNITDKVELHGSPVLYFNTNECPFPGKEITLYDGPEAFWIGWEKSRQERSREITEKGSSAEIVVFAHGNFRDRRITLGSLENYDSETRQYMQNDVFPVTINFQFSNIG